MNSNEYKLNLIVTYNEKSFNEESSDIFSLEQIKNMSIEKFFISKEDAKYMKFTCLNNKEKICFIESDDDIITNISKKDLDHYEIKMKLSIDKKDINIPKKIQNDNFEKAIEKKIDKIINDFKKSSIKVDIKEKEQLYLDFTKKYILKYEKKKI